MMNKCGMTGDGTTDTNVRLAVGAMGWTNMRRRGRSIGSPSNLDGENIRVSALSAFEGSELVVTRTPSGAGSSHRLDAPTTRVVVSQKFSMTRALIWS